VALWELSVLPKNTTRCLRPGLEPGPLNPETSALSMRSPCLPCSIEKKLKSLHCFIEILHLYHQLSGYIITKKMNWVLIFPEQQKYLMTLPGRRSWEMRNHSSKRWKDENQITAFGNHPIITAVKFWPQQKLSQLFSCLKNRLSTSPLLIEPDFCGHLLTMDQWSSTAPEIFNTYSRSSYPPSASGIKKM